jgi:hypothetical protein
MIRFALGFFLVYGAVGNLDFDPNASLLVGAGLAALGLALMAWPVLDGTVVDPALRSR